MTLIASPPSASVGPVTSAPSTFWLSDPTIAGSAVAIHVKPASLSTKFPEALTEHQPLGNPAAIVIGDVLGLEDGQATIWTMSATDETALLALLKSQKILFLQAPDGRSWYIRITSPRPTAQPYRVLTGGYREHAITWRGQSKP